MKNIYNVTLILTDDALGVDDDELDDEETIKSNIIDALGLEGYEIDDVKLTKQ